MSGATNRAVEILLDTMNSDMRIRKAVYYVTADCAVKLTRRHKRENDGRVEYVLTVGRPNWKERDYLRNKTLPLPVRVTMFKEEGK